MPKKTYSIRFYQGTIALDAAVKSVGEAFKVASEKNTSITQGDDLHELRNLTPTGLANKNWQGVLARIRRKDLPHAGKVGGSERELPIAEDEGLVEKCHFIYYGKLNILAFQENRNASSVRWLGECLTHACEMETVSFDDVLRLEPMKRLMNAQAFAKSLDLRIARPKNMGIVPDDQWNKWIFDLMDGANGANLHLQIRGEGRSKDQETRFLSNRLKPALRELIQGGSVKGAKLELDENGHAHPVDLIADRLFSKQMVNVEGRYPKADSMFSAIESAYGEVKDELEELFGKYAA